ncbi:11526_t:CDS:1, partial [Cetraspora pellucida]
QYNKMKRVQNKKTAQKVILRKCIQSCSQNNVESLHEYFSDSESLQENFFYRSQHIDNFEYGFFIASDTSDDLECNFSTASDMSNSSVQSAVTEEIELQMEEENEFRQII